MSALAYQPTILIADDDPFMVKLLSTVILKAFGKRVVLHGTSTASAAHDWLHEHTCDIVLSDLDMPGLNGLQWLTLAKQRNAWTQVILVMANAPWDRLASAFERGASDYLLKPIDPGEVLAVVEQAYARGGRWHRAARAALQTVGV